MESVAEAAQFIRDNAPLVREWTDETLVNWVAFCLNRRRMVCIRDENQQVVAVGAARCLGEDTNQFDYYDHDELGNTIFVDLVAGKGKLLILWEAMKHRYGKRKFVSFRRENNGQVRTYDLHEFEQRLNRHGKLPATAA